MSYKIFKKTTQGYSSGISVTPISKMLEELEIAKRNSDKALNILSLLLEDSPLYVITDIKNWLKNKSSCSMSGNSFRIVKFNNNLIEIENSCDFNDCDSMVIDQNVFYDLLVKWENLVNLSVDEIKLTRNGDKFDLIGFYKENSRNI